MKVLGLTAVSDVVILWLTNLRFCSWIWGWLAEWGR